MPGQSAYNAAKFAVRGFTEALRQEMLVAKHPVKVTCVHPGGIKTAVARNATVAEGENLQTFAEFFDKRLGDHSPEMAAETIANGVAKGHARVVVGWEAKAFDGLARIMGSSYQRGGCRRSGEILPVGEVTTLNSERDITMKTTAAVLLEAGKPFELMELDLDGPGPGEVLIKYTAAGLCHSDLHLTDGDLHRGTRSWVAMRLPGSSRRLGPASPRSRRRPRGVQLHPELRDLPLLLDWPAEPLRYGCDDP